MADLNDFFAKKDQKKKKKPKASSKSLKSDSNSLENGDSIGLSGKAAGPGGGGISGSAQKFSSSGRPGKGDDGWIELADERTAQVNTGGRTVAEFKRDNDDKDQNGDGDTPVEKFNGWSVGAKEENAEDGVTEIAAAPVTSYPSLADTADAPQLPKNRGPGGGGAGTGRRYGNSAFGASLRKMLAERHADPKSAADGGKPNP